ncbi:hypothetical protein L6304_06175 [bacterium]|nr:hypothetical protein [bacterium]
MVKFRNMRNIAILLVILGLVIILSGQAWTDPIRDNVTIKQESTVVQGRPFSNGARKKKPTISGSLERGYRFTDLDEDVDFLEGENEDLVYRYDKGYLKILQPFKRGETSFKYKYFIRDYSSPNRIRDSHAHYFTPGLKYRLTDIYTLGLKLEIKDKNYTHGGIDDNLTLSPSIELGIKPRPKESYNLKYSYKHQDFPNNSVKDNQLHILSLSARKEFIDCLTLKGRARALYKDYKHTAPQRKDFWKESFTLGLGYHKRKTKLPIIDLSLTRGHRATSLDEDIPFQETEEEGDAYRFHKGYIKYTQPIGEKYEPFFKYEFDDKDYYYSVDRNKDSIAQYYTPGLKIKVTKKVTIKGLITIKDKDYENVEVNDYRVISPSIEFRFRPKVATLYLIKYTHKNQDYLRDPSRDNHQNILLLSWSGRMTKDLTLKAKYELLVKNYDHPSPQRRDTTKHLVSTGFEYRF